MKDCPEGKFYCPCSEYSKDGLCDWPYRKDMSLEQIRYVTELLKVIQIDAPDARPELDKLQRAHG